MEILRLLKTFVKGGVVILIPFVFSVVMSLLCFAGVALVMCLENGHFYSHFIEASHEHGAYVMWFVVGVLLLFWHYVVD
jgi:hypothetical protein